MSDAYQKILTFSLGNEDYGASIIKIKEIIGIMNVIPLPRTPKFIKGVINLRGKIIPVMDLRMRFKMDEREYDNETCIVIAESTISGINRLFGIIVDKISEVITIADDEIEPPPEYGENSEHTSIVGIGKFKDKIVIILDTDEILAGEDVINILENVKEIQNIKEASNV
jgi:purine-binding chemotaxis protein CheW